MILPVSRRAIQRYVCKAQCILYDTRLSSFEDFVCIAILSLAKLLSAFQVSVIFGFSGFTGVLVTTAVVTSSLLPKESLNKIMKTKAQPLKSGKRAFCLRYYNWKAKSDVNPTIYCNCHCPLWHTPVERLQGQGHRLQCWFRLIDM